MHANNVLPHVVIKMVAMVSDSDTEWEEEISNKPAQEKGSVSKRPKPDLN